MEFKLSCIRIPCLSSTTDALHQARKRPSSYENSQLKTTKGNEILKNSISRESEVQLKSKDSESKKPTQLSSIRHDLIFSTPVPVGVLVEKILPSETSGASKSQESLPTRWVAKLKNTVTNHPRLAVAAGFATAIFLAAIVYRRIEAKNQVPINHTSNGITTAAEEENLDFTDILYGTTLEDEEFWDETFDESDTKKGKPNLKEFIEDNLVDENMDILIGKEKESNKVPFGSVTSSTPKVLNSTANHSRKHSRPSHSPIATPTIQPSHTQAPPASHKPSASTSPIATPTIQPSHTQAPIVSQKPSASTSPTATPTGMPSQNIQKEVMNQKKNNDDVIQTIFTDTLNADDSSVYTYNNNPITRFGAKYGYNSSQSMTCAAFAPIVIFLIGKGLRTLLLK